MATDKLINQSQGDDIISALDDIATGVGNLSYGEQTSADKVVAMTGYQKESTAAAISPGDSLNVAIGKLEKKVDDNTANKVAGPSSTVVDENIVLFDGSDGKTVKSSGVAISKSTDQYPVVDDDAHIPTTKVVKRYVDETATGISRYLGTITSVSDLDTDAKKGDFYIAAAAWGDVHVCDEIIAEKDGPSKSIDGTNWRLLHNEAMPIVNTWTDPANTTTPSTLLVDTRLDTAESNIAYNLDNGVKNVLPINVNALKAINLNGSWTGNSYLYNGVRYTVNADGSITITRTSSSSSDSTFNLEMRVGNKYVGYYLSGGSDYCAIIMLTTSGNTALAVRTTANAVPSNATGNMNLYVRSSDNPDNHTVYPMICTQGAWDQSHDYQPHALPNSSLTALSIYNNINGVKNLIDCEDSTGTRMVAVPCNLKAGRYVFSFGSLTGYSTTTQLIFMKPDGIQIAVWVYCPHGNNVSTEAEIPEDFATIRVLSGGTWDESAGQTVSFTNFMVCDPATFNVDSSYQPYALPNSALTPALIEQVDSGAKQKFNTSLELIKAANTTGGSWNNNVFTSSDGNVTYTVNSDLSISVSSNGTNALSVLYLLPTGGSYYVSMTPSDIMTGCPKGGHKDTYTLRAYNPYGTAIADDTGDGYIPLENKQVVPGIIIKANISLSATYYPMICSLADWNVSKKYVPYTLSNTTLTPILIEQVNNGAKNRLDCSLDTLKAINTIGTNSVSAWNGNVCTFKSGSTTIGVVTVNTDNSITIEASTGSSEVWFKLASNKQFNNEKLFLSGSPEGGAANTYGIELDINNIRDTGSGVVFQLTSDDVYIYVKASQSWTKTFYPMICTPEEYAISSNYQPFGVGNQILTSALIQKVDEGAKNELQLYPTPGTYTKDGITYTVYSDGSVQADGTCSLAAGVNSQFKLLTSDSGGYVPNNYIGYIASGCSRGSLDPEPNPTYGLLIMYSNSGTSWANQDPIFNGGNVTIKNYPYFTFNIIIYGGKTIHQRFYPMLCTKADWDISHKFVPYAIPNTVITSELIDIVDNGPKNLLNLETCSISSTHGAVTFTVSGNTITVSSTGPSDVQEVRIADLSLPIDVDLAISGCPAGGSENTYLVDAFSNGGYIPGQTGDTGSGEITRFTTMTNSRIRIRIAPNATFTNKVFNMMVCTKAAWDVSHKFVPYRLPYDEVQSKTTLLMNNMGGLTFTGNDLNTLVTGGRYLVNNATDNPVSNAPYNSWQTVEVFQSDYSTYPKVYYQIATDVTGATVTSKWRRRVYNSGGQYNAWTAWSS